MGNNALEAKGHNFKQCLIVATSLEALLSDRPTHHHPQHAKGKNSVCQKCTLRAIIRASTSNACSSRRGHSEGQLVMSHTLKYQCRALSLHEFVGMAENLHWKPSEHSLFPLHKIFCLTQIFTKSYSLNRRSPCISEYCSTGKVLRSESPIINVSDKLFFILLLILHVVRRPKQSCIESHWCQGVALRHGGRDMDRIFLVVSSQ